MKTHQFLSARLGLLITDLSHVLSSFRRNPVFSVAAILTIALGVGTNAAVFSVINAVLLQPLPFRDPGSLVQVWETHPEFPTLQVAAPDFQDWQRSCNSFEQIGAYTFQAINRVTLFERDEAEQLQATVVSWQLLPMLGVEPLRGRNFAFEDESRGQHVVLLNEDLWRRRFGSDPGVVGRAIRLDKDAFVVIGIVPSKKAFPVWADLWLPLCFLDPALQTNRQYHGLEVVGRLAHGISLEKAQAELQSISLHLADAYPATNGKIGAVVVPLTRQVTGEVRPVLLIVWAAVGLVLCIACVNVAHLVLARNASRTPELAIRAALGARRGHILRELLSENLMLSLSGGTLGLVLAAWVVPLLRRLAAGQIPRLGDVGINMPVFLFTLALSTLCGVVFALPAWSQAFRLDLNLALKRTAGGAGLPYRSRSRSMLVAAEVAFAMAVLVVGVLLVRSFQSLLSVEPGFHAQNVLAVELSLPASEYDWQGAHRFFAEDLVPKLKALPGVDSVAAANCIPMSIAPTEHSRYATRFGVAGVQYPAGRYPVAQLRWVDGDYFRVLGIPLRGGRLLTDADQQQPRYLINEELARRYFPGQNPVGMRLMTGVVGPAPTAVEIVGVVGDVRDLALDEPVRPTIYLSASSPRLNLLLRTSPGAQMVMPAVLRAIRSANREIAVNRAETVEDAVTHSIARIRFALFLMLAFSALATLLAMLGVYGVAAYMTIRRTREFAMRLALGACPSHLYLAVLRRSLAMPALGLLAGTAMAAALARLMSSLLYHVAPGDPAALAASAFLLLLLSLVSVVLPLWRILQREPWSTLREE